MRLRGGSGSGLGGLCALWLRSERTSGADTLCLSFRLKSENTGRLFTGVLASEGGGELLSTGDEGGEERDGASEKVGSGGWGLELRSAEAMRAGDGGFAGDPDAEVASSVDSRHASSTRRRLVGGSPSYVGRLVWREYVLTTFLNPR